MSTEGPAVDAAMSHVVGHVVASKVLGDDSVTNAPIDVSRSHALPIHAPVWNALAACGLVEDFSVLAVGVINRHEDGAIEARDLERFIAIIENKAAYVDDSLADFLSALRDLALYALDRSVPLVFKIE